MRYHPSSASSNSANRLDAKREEFCQNFDDGKFTKKRRKCDENVEKKFKPACYEDFGRFMFKSGMGVDEIDTLEDCSVSGKFKIFGNTKWGYLVRPPIFAQSKSAVIEELTVDDATKMGCVTA